MTPQKERYTRAGASQRSFWLDSHKAVRQSPAATLQFGARRQLHHVDVTAHLCVHTLHATLGTTEAAAEIARVTCVRVHTRVRVNPSESLALTAINASQRTGTHWTSVRVEINSKLAVCTHSLWKATDVAIHAGAQECAAWVCEQGVSRQAMSDHASSASAAVGNASAASSSTAAAAAAATGE